MSDFLGRLLARSLPAMPEAAATTETAPVALVRPRLASRFEPVSPGLPPFGEEGRDGEDLEGESFVRPGREGDGGRSAPFEAGMGSTLAHAAGEGRGWEAPAQEPALPAAPSPSLPRADARERAPAALPPAASPARAGDTVAPRLETAPGGGALSRAAGEGRGGGVPAQEPVRPAAPTPAVPRADARERGPAALPEPVRPLPRQAGDAINPRLDPHPGGGALSRAAGEGRGGGIPVQVERLRTETVIRHETAPAPSTPPPPVLQPRIAAVEPFPSRRAEPAAEPVIHVTIGRIEVKATPAPKAPARERAAAPATAGLDEYLRQRARGETR